MSLKICRTQIEEVEQLLVIEKEAFQPDLELYEDYESSPATESIERLKKKVEKFYHFTIFHQEKIIGGIDIRVLPENHFRLNRIFFHPSFQNQGFGTKIMEMVENEFPTAKYWSLDTPFKNYRNHHFYEKFGYKKVGEHRVSNKLVLFDYEKCFESL